MQDLHTYLYIEEAQSESLTCIAVNNTNIRNYNQLILSDLGGGIGLRHIILTDSDLDNNIQTYRSLHGRSSGRDVQAPFAFVPFDNK